MVERPILFSGPMVRAILAGSKTATRRVAKLTLGGHVKEVGGHRRWHPGDPDAWQASPFGGPGTTLWVRESFWVPLWHDLKPPTSTETGVGCCIGYGPECPGQPHRDGGPWIKRPSIHMPRWASRLTLEVTSVRIERLHAITNEDALAEGALEATDLHPYIGAMTCDQARDAFSLVWDAINGKRHPWASDPWVWCISFRRAE